MAGRKQRHLYNSAHEAARAGRLLSTQVRTVVGVAGIVVILGAKGLTIKTPPTGTTVMTARQLLPWLARRPVVLGPRQITALSAVAARPETWRRTTSNLVDPGFVRYEFAKLRAAVESARRRRIGWVLGLFLGGPVVVNTLFYAFPLLVRF
ncbi:hypothetical protein ACQQCD_00820 [Pseudarthrobacter sp. J1763]|uniref:hypothetical protein n=1 Tax=Pseudarthrobacter sp. J1763 TaxID=3420445 RepID=UPI003D2CDA24